MIKKYKDVLNDEKCIFLFSYILNSGYDNYLKIFDAIIESTTKPDFYGVNIAIQIYFNYFCKNNKNIIAIKNVLDKIYYKIQEFCMNPYNNGDDETISYFFDIIIANFEYFNQNTKYLNFIKEYIDNTINYKRNMYWYLKGIYNLNKLTLFKSVVDMLPNINKYYLYIGANLENNIIIKMIRNRIIELNIHNTIEFKN